MGYQKCKHKRKHTMRKLYNSWLKASLCFLLSAFLANPAQAQIGNSGFENGSLAPWSTMANASASTGFTELNWTVNPSGSYMAMLEPTSGFYQNDAEANLGLTMGALHAFNSGLFNTATNFGAMKQDISLAAGQTIVLYWNYVSRDYSPFNDGIIATLVGPSGYQSIQLLAVTSNSFGNTQAIQTGSYGSTGWHPVTFTASAAGIYTLGFACFNTGDEVVDPILSIDNAPGGTSAPGEPIVITNTVNATNCSSAEVNSEVTSDGGSFVTARGVCWGTSSQPTLANNHTTDGTGTGTYSSTMTGLAPSVNYFVRSYATNIVGTVYGSELTVRTGPATPVITTSGSTTLCPGTTVQLNATPAAFYQWYHNFQQVSGATGASFTASQAGSYSVRVTNSLGCTAMSPSVNILFYSAPPTPTITAAGPTSFCVGGSTTLFASSGSSYLWSNNSTGSSLNVSTPGTFTVTVTGPNGCAATSAPTTVTVNPNPAVTATSNSPVTATNTLQLTASGAATYSWSGPNGFSSSTQNPAIPNVTLAAAGTYSVTGTSAAGCSATVSTNVNVLAAPGVALHFDGLNDWVNVSNMPAISAIPVTMEAMVNPELRTEGNQFYPNNILSNDVPGQHGLGFGANVYGGGSRIVVEYKNGFREIMNPAGLVAGQWVHIAVVYNYGNVKTYVNGVMVDDHSYPQATLNGNTNMNIGKHNDDGGYGTRRFFKGSIDEVRVWNRALCSAEINAQFACQLNGSGNGLYANYNFDAGISNASNAGITLLEDVTPNSGNGVLTDFALTGATSNWIGNDGTPGACAPYLVGDINLNGNGNTIYAGATATSVSDHTDLGSVTLGSAVSKTYTIENTGTGSLNVSGLNLSGVNATSFAVSGITFPMSIPSGGSTSFDVAFAATSTGAKHATVHVISNDCDEATYSFAITATGQCAAMVASATGTAPACPGGNTGQIVFAAPVTGTAPFTYSINNGATYQSGSSFSGMTAGSYSITVKDSYGCVSASSTVSVPAGTENVPPAFTAPAAGTMSLSANCSVMIPNLVAGLTGTDNCGTVTFTQSPVAGTILTSSHNATHNVVVTANDGNGNTTPQTVVMTALDNTIPAITAPAPVTATTGTGTCTASGVPLGNAVFTDNCSGAIVSNDAPAFFPIGNTTVTWTVTDAAGLTASASQTVSVTDDQHPVIDGLPADIVVSNDPGQCGAAVSWPTPTATDNCPDAVLALTGGISNGGMFPKGTTTVTYTATDATGNNTSASFSVTVNDTELPVMACSPDLNLTNTPGDCGAFVYYPVPTATDNCGGGNIQGYTMSNTPYQTYNMSGATWLGSGDDAQFGPVSLPFSFNFYGTSFSSVYPSTNGFVSFQNTGSGCCSGQQLPNAWYANSIFAAWSDWVSGVQYKIVGSAPNRVAVFEISGNAYSGGGSLSTQIALHETSNNVQIINSNVSNASYVRTEGLNKDGSIATAVPNRNAAYGWTTSNESILFTPTSSNGPGPIAVTQTAGLPSGSLFPIGATTNTYETTDASGNTNTCSFTVTVSDNELPVVTAPADVSVSTDAGACTASNIALGYAAGNDNCPGFTVTHDAPAVFPKGTTMVTWTVTDVAGLSASVSQTVTVTDNELPTISAPVNISVSTDAGTCSASNVALGIASFGDNCPGATIVNDAPASFSKGTTTVTWTVTDAAGLTAVTTQDVTVTDDEMPAIAAPATVSVTTDAGACSAANVALGTAAYSDNCPGSTVTNDAPAVYPKGTTTVTWTITDAAGLSATAQQSVIVTDMELPTITAPAGVNVNTDAGVCSASNVALGTAAFGDNCPGAVVTNDAPSVYPKGSTTVTWTVTDAGNLTATATQIVVVTDNEVPAVVTQPVLVHLDAAGNGSVSASQIDNGSTDNCAIAGLSLSKTSFNCSDAGQNTVVLTVTDEDGNVSSATATVTVVDAVAPVALAQNVTVQLDAAGNGSVTAAQINNNSTDACGIADLSVSQSSFNCSNVGPNTVTLTVTDVNGNSSAATATVTVEDNVAAQVITQNVTVELNASGSASITAAQINNGSNDACGIGGMTLNLTAFDCSDIGANTVTLTVTDVHGNVSAGTATVTVYDHIAPVVRTRNLTVNLVNGGATITPQQVDSASSDACGIKTMSLNKTTFNCTSIGTHTVTLTVEDNNGNVSTGTAVITVTGSIPVAGIQSVPTSAVFTGGVATDLYLGYGAPGANLQVTAVNGAPYTYSWTPGANLNNVSSNNPLFTPTAGGTYPYTVVVTNKNGCKDTATIVFCVKDIRVPGSNGKVYLCHAPNGNPANAQTLSISANAVPAHLTGHAGDKLGTCGQTCGSTIAKSVVQELNVIGDEVKLYPNPNNGTFTIELPHIEDGNAQIQVTDAQGKMIQRKSVTEQDGHKISIDLGGVAAGVYFVEVSYGTQRFRTKFMVQ
ncbi:MAG: HYR domain-containing protein [Sphingobacteriales bacterium]|nr:MAG: HYR domain-containing protein [Sphingobacteriales bacterium]